MTEHERDVDLKGEAKLLGKYRGQILSIEHFEEYHRWVSKWEAGYVAEKCLDKNRLKTWVINHTSDNFDVKKLVELIVEGYFDVGRDCPLLFYITEGEALLQPEEKSDVKT